MATSDSDLLNAARQHVPEAWDTLLKRHQLPLYTYAAELLRDDDAALDVVQETFATAVRHIASLRADHKFSSWLFGIAHQKCVQHWRNVRRDGKVFATTEADTQLVDVADADGADPRALLLQREQADELLALVGRLAAPHRSVLLLYVLENFSIEENAAITSAPVGTIKSRLHYAKRALRQLLERTRCVT